MNKWSVGVDIVDVARFRQLDYFSRKRFYERFFTPREIEHCLSFRYSAPHFAANYAAKEAVYKALNGFCDVKLNEIEVLRDKAGAPSVNLCPSQRGVAKHKGNNVHSLFEIKVSLSHTASYAVAFAVVSYPKKLVKNPRLRIENGVLT